GLMHTGVASGGDRSPVIQGYRRGRPTPPWTFGALAGCGALRSTVGDLLCFMRACLQPPATPAGDAIVMSRRRRRDGPAPDSGVALGWLIRQVQGHAILWHNGGTYGSSSFLAVDDERSMAVLALGTAGPRSRPPLDGACWALLDDLARLC
ncbi:MAG: serine hydrolase, partial [Actinomycetota bacterium]|nr:serine hydrolase [Actinomycetota bacterium]